MDRRASAVDLMLLGTILLWALNVTVTRYVVTHGFKPLAYGTVRYFASPRVRRREPRPAPIGAGAE